MTTFVTAPAGAPRRAARIPTVAKLAYTVFVAVVVPYYWVTYTPWNFLYFCDIALLVTLVGLWRESPFLISTQAVGIMLPQMLWVVDFGARVVSGHYLTGMTAYMFDPGIPLFVRTLSSFHGWLPFVLLWFLALLGYHRRAIGPQAALIVAVFLVCYFVAPPPPPPASRPKAAVNINYAYGLDDQHAQTWMAPGLWLMSMTGFMLVCASVTHFTLQRMFPEPDVRTKLK